MVPKEVLFDEHQMLLKKVSKTFVFTQTGGRQILFHYIRIGKVRFIFLRVTVSGKVNGRVMAKDLGTVTLLYQSMDKLVIDMAKEVEFTAIQ